MQAFIQALLSKAIFSQRLSFLLFTTSVNLNVQIVGTCIFNTIFEKDILPATDKHHFPHKYYGLGIKNTTPSLNLMHKSQ